MKKILPLMLLALLMFMHTDIMVQAKGGKESTTSTTEEKVIKDSDIDYKDATSFEKALNDGEDEKEKL